LFSVEEYPQGTTIKLQTASGWKNAPDEANLLEAELKLLYRRAKYPVKEKSWHMLVVDTKSNGYDKVILSESKDAKAAFAELSVGQWSMEVNEMKKYFVTTLIGLTLFLLISTAWAGTLRDNFDDGNTDGWRLFKGSAAGGFAIDDSAKWFAEKGELVCHSKGICQLASTFGIGDEVWKDYEFECQFKVERTFILVGCGYPSFFGIGVHYNDANGLITGIDVGGASRGGGWNASFCELFHRGGGNGIGVVGNVPIEERKWYTSLFVVKDNNYEVSIDGKLICKFKNELIDGGGVAFLGRNGEYHFDNIVVTGDDIPNKNMGLPVDSKAKLTTIWAIIKQVR
jgi:hypothetical protein